MAHFIDTKTFQVIDNVLVDARPRFAEFSRDGKCSSVTPGILKVIFFTTLRVSTSMTETVPPTSAETGTKAFIALGPANRVAVVDAKTYEVQKYLPVGQRDARDLEGDLLHHLAGLDVDDRDGAADLGRDPQPLSACA
jgi:DNA-binding beta-propeller fold protein YncE